MTTESLFSAVHDECLGCDVTGPAVYVAAAHPISCTWMMRTARRCVEHDEILRPGESTCPNPEVPEEWADPHNRLGTR